MCTVLGPTGILHDDNVAINSICFAYCSSASPAAAFTVIIINAVCVVEMFVYGICNTIIVLGGNGYNFDVFRTAVLA